MTDFLLELRCEEIPARMQLKASDDLKVRLGGRLGDFGLGDLDIVTFVTPRRLAIIVRDLPLTTRPIVTEYKGPRTSAPEQALAGFLRSNGLTKEQLEDRNGIWFADVNKPGRAVSDLLAEIVPEIIRAFPWPKSMRWGTASQTTESLRWVRPLKGIVAILGDELVDVEIEGVRSGYATLGHRFHHPGEITIGGAHDYVEKLRACHVIASLPERQAIIETRAAEAAAAHGYAVIEDKGLIAENAGLTEWPVPLLGDFDPAFLEVPPEVIQLTLRINQKYFVLRDAAGKLAPAFICTANIEAKDGGAAIIAGNRKVLAARLSDARFFWEQDRRTPLADQAKKLERITFHEKLGTVADKVERVAKLARWLVEEGIVTPNPVIPANAGISLSSASAKGSEMPAFAGMTKEALADMAEQAARLAKADLVTEMVGEFPELQGIMGGYYARAEGLPDAVADAIRDHYKPVGQGDDVPAAPVTIAVSLADKLDTLVGFFGIEQGPTGSKDPFALRRAALSILRLLEHNGLRLNLKKVHAVALVDHVYRHVFLNSKALADVDAQALAKFGLDPARVTEVEWQAANLARPEIKSFVGAFAASDAPFLDFFADRLKVQQKEAGVRHDLIDAVFALGGEDDLVRLLARVKALQSFVATDDGANLLAGYKRAANILKKEGVEQADAISLSYTPEKAEADLLAALDGAEPRAAQAVAAEDFEGAMAALATLRAPIDAFFDAVTVNDADPAKRTTRLALLARVRAAVHNVADFSKITG